MKENNSTAQKSRGLWRRWLAVVGTIGIAMLAGLGNVPGPHAAAVRTSSTGQKLGNIIQKIARAVTVNLPANRRFAVIRFWEYGQKQPLLTIRANNPQTRPLPWTVVLAANPVWAKAPHFTVKQADPKTHPTLRHGMQLGWFAVQVWDDKGRQSAHFLEIVQRFPRGYLACSKWRTDRKSYPGKVTKSSVRSWFKRQFASAPPLPTAPPPAPPRKKRR